MQVSDLALPTAQVSPSVENFIRKFVVRCAHLGDLVGLGTVTPQAARFLEACVVSGLNIIVAGGTQAGNPGWLPVPFPGDPGVGASGVVVTPLMHYPSLRSRATVATRGIRPAPMKDREV